MTNRRSVIGLIILVLMLVGCAKNVVPHPNQLSTLDGQAYDTLLTAQAALDSAKAQYKAGAFANVPNAKLAIDTAGQSYNAARASWLYYHDVLSGAKTGDTTQLATKLQADLNDLIKAIAAVAKVGGKTP